MKGKQTNLVAEMQQQQQACKYTHSSSLHMRFRRRLSEAYSSESDEELNYDEIPKGIKFEIENDKVQTVNS